MRLYKFVSAKHGLDNVRCRRIKIGEFPKLNDPFELNPFVYSDAHNKEVMERLRKRIGDTSGIVSYSKTPFNPVMWAHYAENHQGLCLGIDAIDAVPGTPAKLAHPDTHAHVKEITYVDEPYPFPTHVDDVNEELIHKFIWTKFRHWQYEDEYRVMTTITDRLKNGLCFTDFGPQTALKEVIIGYRSKVTARKIRQAIDPKYGDEVDIWKVVPSTTAFKMERDTSF